jgi:ribonuclease Z
MSVVTRLPPQSSFMQPNDYVEIRPSRRVIVDPVFGEKDRFHSAMAAEVPPELSLTTKEKFTKAKGIVGSHLAKLGDGVPNIGDELVVVPLGTNSAISSRYRNGDYSSVTLFSVIDLQTVSGQLIQIPDWGDFLLDAGEGTWGQMARYFGTDPARPSNVWQALRRLKCIFISHAHADHHVGLAKILAMRKKVTLLCLTITMWPASNEYTNSSTRHLQSRFTLSQFYRSTCTCASSPTWKTLVYPIRWTRRTASYPF